LRPVKIAPSILAYDLSNLRAAVDIAEKGGADMAHLDVIDGHFAPNITFGAGTVKALRIGSKIKFDTHLMISQPRRFVHEFLEAGSDVVIFHVEVIDEASFDVLFAIVNAYGSKIGLALKPETELPKWAASRLGRIKTILVLTVNPGFSGQKMDKRQFAKIERINKLVTDSGADVDIEIDGGVEEDNIAEVAKLGGNSFVAGAGVYRRPDPALAIATLRQKAKAARGVA
jgi:ribulose-phosphate 3-epimerase